MLSKKNKLYLNTNLPYKDSEAKLAFWATMKCRALDHETKNKSPKFYFLLRHMKIDIGSHAKPFIVLVVCWVKTVVEMSVFKTEIDGWYTKGKLKLNLKKFVLE